ncbi:MAG: undecaprenyldiphospho-muramoylpentapeptide beta-N-acetylglucosaminyltransferase [Pseudomonadota bacterium]
MMVLEQKTILIMAGGTGGHIFPALAIADEMKRRHYDIVWLGTKKSMESRLVPENNYPIEYIDIAGLRGKGFISLLVMPYKLIKAVLQTFSIFNRIKPDLTVGMGGFVTGPGGLVSWLMGKPLVIHEQNAISGLSNNLLSVIARQCLTAFPGAYRGWFKRKDTAVTGNPVRKDILAVNKKSLDQQQNRQQKKTLNILVIGGSLGAQKVNEVVPLALQKLQLETDKNKPENYQSYQVRHQCGKGKVEQVKTIIAGNFFDQNSHIKITYQLEEFISDMAEVYKWADLIICRSGALTISEIASVGISSILIPFPYAVDDHQTENAKFLTENQAGFLLPQNKLNAQSLKLLIEQCTVEKLTKMAKKAKQLARPKATIEVTDRCLSWINNRAVDKSKTGKLL